MPARKSRVLWTLSVLASAVAAPAQSQWHQQESEHFRVVYREPHGYLVPDVLHAAENSLATLGTLFDYAPSERITIITHDASDYGGATATAVPHNVIRLAIGPLELGYEQAPHRDRIQWLLSHELVHIVVGDRASGAEAASRRLFSKVPPEPEQPLTIFYSLLTSRGRYTPQWHQEGIAVFLETWLSGGFGRVLSSFDEMYFRSLALEAQPFPDAAVLEGETAQTSFLVGTAHYLYGARLMAYLAATYGAEQLLAWFRSASGPLAEGYERRFQQIFGIELTAAWADFIGSEQAFQEVNLQRLRGAPQTPLRRLRQEPLGWVAQPHLDPTGTRIFLAHHEPHRLSAVAALDLRNGALEEIARVSSPSLTRVASTAFDRSTGTFFYTTNNNRLYRDIWTLDTATRRARQLFENVRVGELTVAPSTGELWGVRHSAGKASLVYSAPPYRRMLSVAEFEMGDALQHLGVSPSGRFLAATLHRPGGGQAVIVADVERLKDGRGFIYRVISDEGSPEFPSWSPDEAFLYWSAFTNGVSNIYRHRLGTTETEAMTHTLRGLFRPLQVSPDTLFAFEFTSDGFIPVLVPNRPAARVPAIRYYGQGVIDRSPEVGRWTLPRRDRAESREGPSQERAYRGVAHLQVDGMSPVVSGFGARKVVGLYGHLTDPLAVHDVKFELGLSPFGEDGTASEVHVRGTYEYKRAYRFELDHNAPDFYDLFNRRKTGHRGTRLSLAQTHYWRYDVPHEVLQTTELTFLSGIDAIHDGQVDVIGSQFALFQSSLESNHTRRTVGSVDKEFGDEWTVTLLGMGSRSPGLQTAAGIQADLSRYVTWARPHNVLHVQLAGGYLRAAEAMTLGKFYLGGFGNRLLEHEGPKQYRRVLRFPGLSIYSLPTRAFGKLLIEHQLPPLRFGSAVLGSHQLSHLDASWYTQGLLVQSDRDDAFVNLGAQVNLVFKHWSNLESTLSAGVARAWPSAEGSWDCFLSLKLLRTMD